MLSRLTKELCLELEKGKFCYVTGPRAINRPSLCQHTGIEMAQRGYRVVTVSIPTRSIPTPGNKAQAADWDQQVIDSIWQTLHPEDQTQLTRWIETTQHLSPVARLNQFASDLLLSDLCEGPLLLCLDNIDGLFHIPGALDGILEWIACCYELRDTYLTYRHLSIAVFGSVKPVRVELTTNRATVQPQPVFFHAPPRSAKRQMAASQNFKMLLPVFG